MQQLIKNAGGSGEYREVPMPALDIWAALLKVRSSKPCQRHAVQCNPKRHIPCMPWDDASIIEQEQPLSSEHACLCQPPAYHHGQACCTCKMCISSRAACAQGEADATWVFLGHEGVQAEIDCVNLNIFRLADHGIPYGFTPVLVANPEILRCVHIFLPTCAFMPCPAPSHHRQLLGCSAGP